MERSAAVPLERRVALAPYELGTEAVASSMSLLISSGCVKYTEEEVDCCRKERLCVAKLLENLNFPNVLFTPPKNADTTRLI